MDTRVRRDTTAPEEVWVVNSEETAVCRSRDRSLDRRELGSSEAEVDEDDGRPLLGRPVPAVGCIMTNGDAAGQTTPRLAQCQRRAGRTRSVGFNNGSKAGKAIQY